MYELAVGDISKMSRAVEVNIYSKSRIKEFISYQYIPLGTYSFYHTFPSCLGTFYKYFKINKYEKTPCQSPFNQYNRGMTTKKDPKKAEHYVNNKEFTAAVDDFNKLVKKSIAEGKETPRMTEYIGECIYKIATRLSTRPNFINYTYRDEMICDAIENCIQYIGNFNREKSNNAFAYVTQICYYAFLRRIQKEKKQVYIKQQATDAAGITMDAFTTIDGQHDASLTNTNVEWMQENMNRVEYEPRKSKRKPKENTKNNLEKFTKE